MIYLLKGIQYPDPGMHVAMASICTDNGLQGMCNNFEALAAHLLPYDPVIKKQAVSPKYLAAQISALEGDSAEISDTTGKKPSIGKSGVHIHYHMTVEYHKLSVEQDRELREWRVSNRDNKRCKSGKNTMDKREGIPTTSFQITNSSPPLFLRISRGLWLNRMSLKKSQMLKDKLLGWFRPLWPRCQPISQNHLLTLKVPRKVTLQSILEQEKNSST